VHALARDRAVRYPSASALAAAIMHARAAPDDAASLSPAAFATSPRGADPFAITLPGLPAREGGTPSASHSRAPHSPALPGNPSESHMARHVASTSSPPGARDLLLRGIVDPDALPTSDTVPSDPPPSSADSSTTKPSATLAPAPSSRRKDAHAQGAEAPPRSKSSTTMDPANEPVSKRWLFAWVVATLMSIALGVYFALR
jgi:hypothetical protein